MHILHAYFFLEILQLQKQMQSIFSERHGKLGMKIYTVDS